MMESQEGKKTARSADNAPRSGTARVPAVGRENHAPAQLDDQSGLNAPPPATGRVWERHRPGALSSEGTGAVSGDS